MKNNTLNLNDITAQIKQYVRQIKDNKKSDFFSSLPEIENQQPVYYTNDLRSNINKLNGGNKFSLHNITSADIMTGTSAEYASEAYEHLSLRCKRLLRGVDYWRCIFGIYRIR